MSRWDRLLSDDTTTGSSRRKKVSTRPAVFSSRKYPARQGSTTADIESAKLRIETLLGACSADSGEPGPKEIHELCELVSIHHNHLASDIIVHQTFCNVLLPNLSLDNITSTSSITLPILDVSMSLLRADSKHVTAIMAPLVDDVSDEGTEKQVANPVRRRLFECLQHRLLHSDQLGEASSEVLGVEKLCRCLTRALRMAKKIDGTKSHAGESGKDVDPNFIRRILSNYLATRKLKIPCLEVFLAYLERHPDTSSTFVPETLVASMTGRPATTNSQSRACSICGLEHQLDFLLALHSASDTYAAALCMKILSLQLSRLPWHLWFRGERVPGSMQSSSFTFRDRITTGVRNILRVTRCWLQRDYQSVVVALTDLIRVLLNNVPLAGNESIEVLAVELVNDLTETILNTTHQVSRDALCNVLIESMGGKDTPQGQKTRMSSALKRWLGTCQGSTFVQKIIVSLSIDTVVNSTAHQILCAILRSFPEVVFLENAMWDEFQSTIQCLNETESGYRKQSVMLLENLLQGMRDCSPRNDVVSFAVPFLKGGLKVDNNGIRVSACNAFGYLGAGDWRSLTGLGQATAIVGSVLALCTDQSVGAKLRSASCKAVGEISSNLFIQGDFSQGSDAALLVTSTLQTMTRAVEDPNASVRCMALFATGNLVQVLRGQQLHPSVDPRVLVHASRQSFAHLLDPDEKTAGNAIRTIGHVACLVLDINFLDIFTKGGLELPSFLDQVVEALTARVNAAIELSVRPSANKLSWKKRLAVRKQGWGACNSLASIFEGILATTTAAVVSTQPAVDCLYNCLQHLSSLNEKVSVSAMKAIRRFDPRLLRPGRRDALADAVLSCLHYLENNEGTPPGSRLNHELELTLRHLLSCLSSSDAASILRRRSTALFLYRWMMEEQCPSVYFVPFALATQMPGIAVDFQVEQLFSVQAVGRCAADDDNDEL